MSFLPLQILMYHLVTLASPVSWLPEVKALRLALAQPYIPSRVGLTV